jgi:hypothetical protein
VSVITWQDAKAGSTQANEYSSEIFQCIAVEPFGRRPLAVAGDAFFAPDSPAQTGADDRVPPSTSDFPARSMSAFLMVTWKTASLMVFGSTCGAGHTFLSQNDPVCLDFIRAPKSLTVLRACSGYVGKCASIR